jgi:hypothetical protein
MMSLREIKTRFMGTAASFKLSAIAAALSVIFWGMIILGPGNVLRISAAVGIVMLTVVAGLVVLPLSMVDLVKRAARQQGLVAFTLSLVVVTWNILGIWRLIGSIS